MSSCIQATLHFGFPSLGATRRLKHEFNKGEPKARFAGWLPEKTHRQDSNKTRPYLPESKIQVRAMVISPSISILGQKSIKCLGPLPTTGKVPFDHTNSRSRAISPWPWLLLTHLQQPSIAVSWLLGSMEENLEFPKSSSLAIQPNSNEAMEFPRFASRLPKDRHQACEAPAACTARPPAAWHAAGAQLMGSMASMRPGETQRILLVNISWICFATNAHYIYIYMYIIARIMCMCLTLKKCKRA